VSIDRSSFDNQGCFVASATTSSVRKPSKARLWIRRAFLAWALFSTLWLANSVRTQGVDPADLQSSLQVEVLPEGSTLQFLPDANQRKTALIFISGGGISADAYAPLLRPIAQEGYPVFVVNLPYRFAPLESHKQFVVDTVIELASAHSLYSRWVVSGHSLGAALACRVIQASHTSFEAMVLVGTTHPKEVDLSYLTLPVTKVYGSLDGVAKPESIMKNQGLLPTHTRWVEIPGANHSQFGHYGHQLFDGSATISRLEQQRTTREELLIALDAVDDVEPPQPPTEALSDGVPSPATR
jgi:pimeloyl-ACP methyl ester carboxylesterase